MNLKIHFIRGDITTQKVDAIVNAANSSLGGGGGVDGSIHAAAGPELRRTAIQMAPCPPGEARITPAFNLPSKYVIHAVGPVWKGGMKNESKLLASAYENSLELALANNCKTIALPAISCGAYNYPIKEGVEIALGIFSRFSDRFQLINFVSTDGCVFHEYQKHIRQNKK